MFGKLLGKLVRVVNLPLTAMDRLADDGGYEERTISQPLETLAEACDEIDDEDND